MMEEEEDEDEDKEDKSGVSKKGESVMAEIR